MRKSRTMHIEESVIKDFHDGMLTAEIEKKYGYSWTTLRKILIKRGIPLRPSGGYRENTGKKKGTKNMWGG